MLKANPSDVKTLQNTKSSSELQLHLYYIPYENTLLILNTVLECIPVTLIKIINEYINEVFIIKYKIIPKKYNTVIKFQSLNYNNPFSFKLIFTSNKYNKHIYLYPLDTKRRVIIHNDIITQNMKLLLYLYDHDINITVCTINRNDPDKYNLSSYSKVTNKIKLKYDSYDDNVYTIATIIRTIIDLFV